jgi:hypothetical protein
LNVSHGSSPDGDAGRIACAITMFAAVGTHEYNRGLLVSGIRSL